MTDENKPREPTPATQAPPVTPRERAHPEERGPLDHKVWSEHLGRYHFAAGLARGLRVLDVACGAGYAAPFIVGAGAASYTGVDRSEAAIKTARALHTRLRSVQFQIGDACDLSWLEPSSVDLAVSFETIEHLDDPRAFLTALRRVVAPGSTLLFSTPNRALSNPGAPSSAKPKNPYHIREWDAAEFARLLGEFYHVKALLGQGGTPSLWATALALRHRAEARLGTNPALTAALSLYRWASSAARGGPRTARWAQITGPVPVVPARRGWQPEYIICVCTAQ